MTIETVVSKTIQSGNGSNKDFDFSFEIPDEDSLSLTKRASDGTETAITTNFTVTGIGDEAGGSVNYPTSGSALAANEKIIIKRVVALKQPENLRNQGDYSLEDIEDALDRAVMMCQQLQEQINRCLKLNLTSSSTYVNVDDFVANRLLVVSSDGQSIEMSSAEYGSIDAYLSTLTAIADDISAVAGIDTEITTVAGISADVTTVAGISADVTTVAAISSAVSTVSSNNSNVSTVATNIAAVNSVVSNLTAILNAASFNLPTLASGNENKFLKVNASHNGYDLVSSANLTAISNLSLVRGDLIFVNSSSEITRLGKGSTDQVLKSDGTDIAWGTSPKITGDVVQVVNTQTGAAATGTTAIPIDDTAPLNTEGTQFMSLAVTPTSATNILQIDVVLNIAAAVGCYGCLALFQDSNANAIATSEFDLQASYPSQAVLRYRMTAGTTSSTTFKVRAGGNNTTTYTFNGQSGGRLFGGTLVSSITITEIKA